MVRYIFFIFSYFLHISIFFIFSFFSMKKIFSFYEENISSYICLGSNPSSAPYCIILDNLRNLFLLSGDNDLFSVKWG